MKRTIVLIIAVIIIGGSFLWWQQKRSLSITQTQNNSNQLAEWQLYKNNDLKISFSYPKNWGEINKKIESDHVILALAVFNNAVFLGADNGKKALVGRGGYWGDEAEFIINQNYINDFCNDKNNCEIKTNQYGITFAREKRLFSDLGYPTPHESIFYYLFNPKTELKGIIISNERLINNNIESLESKMDSIIDSIEFVD